MGICEILTIIFVIAKIMGKIDWSWLSVFIPMYVAVSFYLGIVSIAVYAIFKNH